MGAILKNGINYTGGGGSEYELPTASETVKGGVKVGDGLQMDGEVLSAVVTKAVNDLTNYYLKTETYTQAEVNALVSAVASGGFEVVEALPTTDISTKTIYLLAKTTAETNNVYDEYIYVNNAWELIGDTTIDLSGYVTTTALNTALANYYTKTQVNDLTGDLDDLETTDKSNLVAAINEAAKSGGSSESKMLTGTLEATGWADNSQTVAVSGLGTTDNGVVGLLNTATDEQVTAAKEAKIKPTAQAENAMTFSCENTPSVDIPFGICIGGR